MKNPNGYGAVIKLGGKRRKPFAVRVTTTYDIDLRNYWEPLLTEINMQHHRPHDTRHTCVSLLTMKDVKLEVIRKIVGHQGKSLTEAVYTHFDFQVLIDAIDLI